MDSQMTEGAAFGSDQSFTWRAVILATIYLLIGLLGITGNSLVIYLMVRVPSLRSVTNVLICNQAMIDLASSIVFLPLYLVYVPPPLQSDLAASVFCKLWASGWPLWAFSVSSTVNFALLTLERYCAVIHPIKYRIKSSVKRAKCLAVIPWIVGPIHELTWALVQVMDLEGNCVPAWPSVALQRVLGVVFFTGHYVLPVTLTIYVYTRIILKLRRDWRSSLSSPSINAHAQRSSAATRPVGPEVSSSAKSRHRADTPDPSPARSQFRLLASKSVLRTLIIVSASYIICWGPNEVIYLLFNFGVDIQFHSFYHDVSVIFVLCNMCLNPIIYAFHYEEFKKALRSMLPCKIGGKMKLWCCWDQSSKHEVKMTPPATVTSQVSLAGMSLL